MPPSTFRTRARRKGTRHIRRYRRRAVRRRRSSGRGRWSSIMPSAIGETSLPASSVSRSACFRAAGGLFFCAGDALPALLGVFFGVTDRFCGGIVRLSIETPRVQSASHAPGIRRFWAQRKFAISRGRSSTRFIFTSCCCDGAAKQQRIQAANAQGVAAHPHAEARHPPLRARRPHLYSPSA